jgi:predicted enzyme related to lactoylglutathione lyase
VTTRPDAFAGLRLPPLAADPDPGFASHLRRQVERALSAPTEGGPVSTDTDTTTDTATDTATGTGTATGSAGQDPPVGVVPYLAVSDGHAALAWYAHALGAAEVGERYTGDDGRIGHAAMRVHGATFYLADGAPELGVEPQQVDAPVSTSLVLTVPDTDAAADRAVAAGARLERSPGDNPYGRVAVVRDPFGHRWMLEGPVRSPASGTQERARPGDLAYATLCTPDADRAATFYGAVLGWEVAPGSVPEGRQVTNTTVQTGIWGGREEQTVRCCWQVDDLEAALGRVHAAGGSAEPPSDQTYGRLAACVDDQGLGFDLYEPAPGELPARTPLNGSRQGDLSYLTLESPDRERALRFYGAVLGWRVGTDGDPADVHPMLGLPAEGASARVLPMWKVDDVAAAVERVRAGGGTATDPERKPYGTTADCTDDQGMPFYLGDV